MSDLFPTWDEILEDRRENYEEGVVQAILKYAEIPGRHKEIKAWAQEYTPDQNPKVKVPMSLEALRAVTGFPFQLVAKRYAHLEQLERDLEERPTKTQPFLDLAELIDQYGEEEGVPAVGVVFRWPGRSMYYILHNRPGWPSRAPAGRFWRLGRGHEAYWLQRLDHFMMDVGPADEW